MPSLRAPKGAPVKDWRALAAATGLNPSDTEVAKLSAVMEPLDHAYRSLVANLTPDVQPATTIAEEVIDQA